MSNERVKTDYEGVYFVSIENGADKEFFVEYDKDGQPADKSVGTASKGMNAETAKSLRDALLKGEDSKADEEAHIQTAKDQQAKVKEKMKSVRKILWDARGD